MKRQGKARHNLSGLRPRRKLRFETLESRELFYAPPMPSIDLPPPPSLSPPVLEKLNRPHQDLSLLPQGSPFNSTRYTPNPIGLFPNGSTQVISPEISPRVVELLQQNESGPVKSTIHRTGVGLGAPIDTLAGMDPKIRELTTMKENWGEAYGEVTRCLQRIEIAPENLGSNVNTDTIYEWLEDFRLFNKNNIATTEVYKPGPLDFPLPAEESYAVFTVHTLDISDRDDPYWKMLNTLQLIINDKDIVVKLYGNPEHHQLAAVTLENHMLVGVRVWRTYETHAGWLRIETEAHEQRNGFINNLAAEMAARSVMEEVWRRYLINLGNAATGGTGRYAKRPAQWFHYPKGQENPWRNPKSIPTPNPIPPSFDFRSPQTTP